MSDKIPFAVLTVHPHSGMEIMTVLAQSHKQALATAASVCVQRQQPDLSVVAAFSIGEIANIYKILERAAFIGEGNGLTPDTVELQERQLVMEYDDEGEEALSENVFDDDLFGGEGADFFEEQNARVVSRPRNLYDMDEDGVPQPKGTVRAHAPSVATEQASPPPVKKEKDAVKKDLQDESTDVNPLEPSSSSAPFTHLDLSQGKKTNEGKRDVFLDDYYNQ